MTPLGTLTRPQLYLYVALLLLRMVAAVLRVVVSAVLDSLRAQVAMVLPASLPRGRPPREVVATAGRLTARDFRRIADPGLGERWIVYPWSMQWWRGKLYVGTDKAFPCVEYYRIHSEFPRLVKYPPRREPDVVCAASPFDMPLAAEIWCYTPESAESATWERVYRSPADAEVDNRPGRFVPRDIGFRNMLLVTEPDGTEALYVAGVGPRAFDRGAPTARLLRSTDGTSFTAVPGVPETVLGGRPVESLRALATHNERLYVTAGAVLGDGALFEVEIPVRDSGAFRQVSPEGMRISEMISFNGYLYVGVRHPLTGYAVMKTDATGAPPYSFVQVVPFGGGRGTLPAQLVPSMHVFQERLYVGTANPAELICIHPDDTWELVVGRPRKTAQGWKRPLSGIGDGFGYALNRNIQRMQVHDGWLYVGTFNVSPKYRNLPTIGRLLRPGMGFHLYATQDGKRFEEITRAGLDEPLSLCVRTLASSPRGLFLGAINAHSGARIYLGAPGNDSPATRDSPAPPQAAPTAAGGLA